MHLSFYSLINFNFKVTVKNKQEKNFFKEFSNRNLYGTVLIFTNLWKSYFFLLLKVLKMFFFLEHCHYQGKYVTSFNGTEMYKRNFRESFTKFYFLSFHGLITPFPLLTFVRYAVIPCLIRLNFSFIADSVLYASMIN